MEHPLSASGRAVLGACTLATTFFSLLSLALAGALAPPNTGVAASAAPPAHDPALATHMRQFALNALLIPLLEGDEDHPPRWRDVELTMPCLMPSGAMVDGAPVAPGDEVLSSSFSVQWKLNQCMPFGPGGPALTGLAELDVFGDDHGISARVRLVDFQIDKDGHRARMDEVFTARTP